MKGIMKDWQAVYFISLITGGFFLEANFMVRTLFITLFVTGYFIVKKVQERKL